MPVSRAERWALEQDVLTGRRAGPVEDRTLAVNRRRGTLRGMFPALERALDVADVGPVKLLTGCQTPAAIGRARFARLTKWLVSRRVRNARAFTETAVEAAELQYTFSRPSRASPRGKGLGQGRWQPPPPHPVPPNAPTRLLHL